MRPSSLLLSPDRVQSSLGGGAFSSRPSAPLSRLSAHAPPRAAYNVSVASRPLRSPLSHAQHPVETRDLPPHPRLHTPDRQSDTGASKSARRMRVARVESCGHARTGARARLSQHRDGKDERVEGEGEEAKHESRAEGHERRGEKKRAEPRRMLQLSVLPIALICHHAIRMLHLAGQPARGWVSRPSVLRSVFRFLPLSCTSIPAIAGTSPNIPSLPRTQSQPQRRRVVVKMIPETSRRHARVSAWPERSCSRASAKPSHLHARPVRLNA